MSLESLLKPVQWADEQVLRYYTKKAEAWEKKGRSKYSLAHLYNLSGAAANIVFMTQADLNFSVGAGVLALQSADFARNVVRERYDPEINTGTVAKPPLSYEITKHLSSLVRLPMLVTGMGLMIKGIAYFIDYVQHKNPESIVHAMQMCSLGYAFFGTASSMYIKESDPQLLEKKLVEEFNLQLQPVPVRIKENK